MSLMSFRLSVEEVALALTQIGQPEMGRDLLLAQLGQPMNQEQMRARLLSAGHTLMARGLLAMKSDGAIIMDAGLERAAHVLIHADFTIRYNRTTPDTDVIVAYHFSSGAIFEHSIQNGVIHAIVEVAGTDTVIGGGLAFFSIASARPFTCAAGDINADVLDSMRNQTDAEATQKNLAQAGAPAQTATLLAEDIAQQSYRGSALKVEYGEGNRPVSEHGILLLGGKERFWLLRPYQREGKAFVTLVAGSERAFRDEIKSLL